MNYLNFWYLCWILVSLLHRDCNPFFPTETLIKDYHFLSALFHKLNTVRLRCQWKYQIFKIVLFHAVWDSNANNFVFRYISIELCLSQIIQISYFHLTILYDIKIPYIFYFFQNILIFLISNLKFHPSLK